MKYTVVQNYFVNEVNVQLVAGDVVHDGDAEPDLVAELVSRGVLEPEYRTSSTAEVSGLKETQSDEPARRNVRHSRGEGN